MNLKFLVYFLEVRQAKVIKHFTLPVVIPAIPGNCTYQGIGLSTVVAECSLLNVPIKEHIGLVLKVLR